jgi:hypothetical protein
VPRVTSRTASRARRQLTGHAVGHDSATLEVGSGWLPCQIPRCSISSRQSGPWAALLRPGLGRRDHRRRRARLGGEMTKLRLTGRLRVPMATLSKSVRW